MSGLTLPEDVVKELAALEGLSPEQLQGLVTTVITFLSRPETFDVGGAVEAYAAEHGIRNLAKLKVLLAAALKFFRECVRQNLSHTNVAAELQKLGLAADKSVSIGKAWRKSSGGMLKGAVHQTVKMNELVDMQWKFGVTASSDDAAQLGSTFLQLKLVTAMGDGLETSYMELTLPQFYEFMHEMEKCKASLDAFSG
jgi:inactivated superfamily I helicase